MSTPYLLRLKINKNHCLNVSEHIKHIFDEGELDEDSVVRNFRITADDVS